ncbi:hypothetical protein [Sandaracinus amylolyticus]|uniref:Uncharacterized protein n=1 Tax=Sandaracinus amylolyticus TaxID=927083 RepID=A0A0F6W5A1_9BACT|nr:hypothetical protein [Sandaracinus amylolyticus]AKF07646.1 hypothetical protein DB32_004795 [Sandaracinus amylolyticus]
MTSQSRPDLVIPLVDSIRVSLRPPVHGWLDVDIDLDEFRLDAAASWVLNDPLEELVDLGSFLARGGSGSRRVCLWGEPAGYAIDAWNLNDTLAQVLLSYAPHFIPPMAGRAMRRKYVCTVERVGLARAIRAAVDELFAKAGAAVAPPHWHAPDRYAQTLVTLREASP